MARRHLAGVTRGAGERSYSPEEDPVVAWIVALIALIALITERNGVKRGWGREYGGGGESE